MLPLPHALREGFSALKANPLRTLLSTLGVVMGVASLTSVLALGDGMEAYARSQIESTTDLQAVAIDPVTRTRVNGVRLERNDWPRWTLSDAQALQSAAPEAVAVGAQLTGEASLTRAADTTTRGSYVVGRLARPAMYPLELAAGRDISVEEGLTGAPVVVVSHDLATSLAGAEPVASLLGDTLRYGDQPRAVIGVMAARTQAGFPTSEMPLDAARPAIQDRDPRVQLILLAGRIEEAPAMKASAERWLRARYGAGWEAEATVTSRAARVEQARQGILVFKLLMGALTGISLIVGGVGIMNVLLASVAERTREIGIRKAIGARHKDVLAQFLAESVAITGAGAVVGGLLGVAAAFGVTAVMRAITDARIYAALAWPTLLSAALAAVATGILFGLYPALRAARLSPIEAIRHE